MMCAMVGNARISPLVLALVGTPSGQPCGGKKRAQGNLGNAWSRKGDVRPGGLRPCKRGGYAGATGGGSQPVVTNCYQERVGTVKLY